MQHTTTYCNIEQHTATYYNILQRSPIYCNIEQHSATYHNILQHTATYCNIMQHTASYCNTVQHTPFSCKLSGPSLESTQPHVHSFRECKAAGARISQFTHIYRRAVPPFPHMPSWHAQNSFSLPLFKLNAAKPRSWLTPRTLNSALLAAGVNEVKIKKQILIRSHQYTRIDLLCRCQWV